MLGFMGISIHALHEESDQNHHDKKRRSGIFQSTLSMRRATRLIPADVLEAIFQSTLSMRRATHVKGLGVNPDEFQSTLSMRRATEPSGHVEPERNISIHALHEESDQFQQPRHRQIPISIHALHEESDNLAPENQPRV
ncbi:hypothetical protein BIFPSEUDO_03110 [Bifidobacterium pseudocatenulatum DSM 20438 = JCM 1200 = LMG 10505]|uniref:Uncharacterized protein n=1 Tax=Bifidobacterium pseudocatenulatum DSM 20438 = JCM 1200 = LMG 10505 TaxID=547043 RepID=C0BSJ1_BIFPS|nr:hypothetical protein BIFPSEUDO_03110 [Bifidobacterium pseudocatenulatum DSM 20438 = JCM 1200 = LMG 10505]